MFEELIIKPFCMHILTQICNIFGLCYIRNEDDVLRFEFKCMEQVNKDLLKEYVHYLFTADTFELGCKLLSNLYGGKYEKYTNDIAYILFPSDRLSIDNGRGSIDKIKEEIKYTRDNLMYKRSHLLEPFPFYCAGIYYKDVNYIRIVFDPHSLIK